MRKILQTLIFIIPIAVFSQEADTLNKSANQADISKLFQLGEIDIIAPRNGVMSGRISSDYMETYNKFNVSQSLDLLPGIALTASGTRNESMISVRGFDLRAVPVYMDGIPVYVPYDGYVDLARFTTFDIAAIDVSKGFSSLLYGPNSMGGAINLISKKPTSIFEIDGALGMINTNSYRANINLGSNFGKFYIQGDFSYLHRASYKMSNEYKAHRFESGGERENSYNTDMKVNLKAGWTPNKNNEFVFGYINQQGKKGNPVYAGDDTLNSLYTKARFWQWPAWNKETFYLLSNSKFKEKHYFKSRFYYDVFKNIINSFDDSTYTSQLKPSSFQSLYNDFTYGGSLEYGTTIIPMNEIKLSVQAKSDVHRENNLNEAVRHFNDVTFNFAIEDIFSIDLKNHHALRIISGISYSGRNNVKAENYNSSTEIISDFEKTGLSNAINAQLGLFYSWKEIHKVSATVSRKTRFATIKDRYSYRMGTAIPNPALQPETSYNTDVTYSVQLFNKLSLQASFFYSYLTNAIISVNNVEPGKSQMQNAGAAQFLGVEIFANYDIKKYLTVGANFTYINRKNLSNPNILFTDVPPIKLFSFVEVKPLTQLSLLLSASYNSFRYSTSYGTKAPQFFLLNGMVSGQIWKFMSIEAGVNNILDKNYMLVEGYPEEGRNFFVTLKFSYHK